MARESTANDPDITPPTVSMVAKVVPDIKMTAD